MNPITYLLICTDLLCWYQLVCTKNLSTYQLVCTDLVFTDLYESKNISVGLHWFGVHWYVWIQEYDDYQSVLYVAVLISCWAVQFVVMLYWFVINWYVNMNTRLVVDMNMNKAVMILNTKQSLVLNTSCNLVHFLQLHWMLVHC